MAIVTQQLLSFLGIDLADLDIYASGRYCVIQRDPQPLEEDIRQETEIGMMVVDLEGDPNEGVGVLGFDFEIYVEATLVLSYVSGTPTWSGGFTGTVDVAELTDPYFHYKVTVQQVVPPMFTSEQVVSVQVIINPPSPLLDVTYDFTIEDLTPPSIIGAVSIGKFVVQIEYDDEMATIGVGSALLSGAYTVVTQNVDPEPGVDLEVVSVTEVIGSGATKFDLEFEWEQTPGCQYLIEVDSAVTDSSGNQIQ